MAAATANSWQRDERDRERKLLFWLFTLFAFIAIYRGRALVCSLTSVATLSVCVPFAIWNVARYARENIPIYKLIHMCCAVYMCMNTYSQRLSFVLSLYIVFASMCVYDFSLSLSRFLYATYFWVNADFSASSFSFFLVCLFRAFCLLWMLLSIPHYRCVADQTNTIAVCMFESRMEPDLGNKIKWNFDKRIKNPNKKQPTAKKATDKRIFRLNIHMPLNRPSDREGEVHSNAENSSRALCGKSIVICGEKKQKQKQNKIECGVKMDLLRCDNDRSTDTVGIRSVISI